MDYYATHTIEADPGSTTVERAIIDCTGDHTKEEYLIRFELRDVKGDQGAHNALLLATKLLRLERYQHAAITIGDIPPIRVHVHLSNYHGVEEIISLLQKLDWLAPEIGQKIIDYCHAELEKMPRHRPVTDEAIKAGLDAFDFEVSKTFNIDYSGRAANGRERLEYFYRLRKQLASPEALYNIATNEEPGRWHKPTMLHYPDAYLSIELLEPALQRIAFRFSRSAHINPQYSKRPQYLGPKTTDPETGRTVDSYPPGDPRRREFLAYTLQNISGITRDESIALLCGIEAYDKAVRKACEVEGATSLTDAYNQIIVERSRFDPSKKLWRY